MLLGSIGVGKVSIFIVNMLSPFISNRHLLCVWLLLVSIKMFTKRLLVRNPLYEVAYLFIRFQCVTL